MNRYASRPPFPDALKRLDELAIDLWWSWNPEARNVFRRLDYLLWHRGQRPEIKAHPRHRTRCSYY